MSEPSITEYTVGWICALQEEFDASCRMLDDEFHGPENGEVNDNNTYVFGYIGRHNVVIGCLPGGQYGTNAAASVARDMVRSFPKLRFALMVGIGGSAPTRDTDIRLGDVVVSEPRGILGGVVQLDLGKQLPDGTFERKGQLDAPPQVLLGVLPHMRRHHNDPKKPDRIAEHIKLMDDMPDYRRPAEDRLYRAEYPHKGGKNCEDCKADELEDRPARSTSREVTIHYGIIASSNSVIKSPKTRDKYARELNILCFETEAAGLANNFQCLVIRGICDYSDSHKNDEWHKYAALTAAAYAREVLHMLKPERVSDMPSWAEKVKEDLLKVSKNIVNQECEDILNWITPVDYSRQQSDFLRIRQPDTGQWLLDSAKFQRWLKTGKQTLFCPGIPGAGKTILTSIVVEQLTTRFESDMSIGVAYLYCNFQRQNDQKDIDLLASLLKQLAQGRSPLPDSVKSLHESHKAKRTRPSIDEISKVLQSVSATYSRVFVIVDALDECQISHGYRTRLIDECFKLQARCEANLFMTSRFLPEITGKFNENNTLEIRATCDDVERYLKNHIRLSSSAIRTNQKEIMIAILDTVDGMFLLAQIYFNLLKDVVKPRKIQTILEGFRRQAAGLGEDRRLKVLRHAYDQAMERINEQNPNHQELAMEVLSWITCARRPLNTEELQHALTVEAGDSNLDERYLPQIDDMVAVCAGLVTVDTKSKIIRLVHYTTQEYFEKTQECWFPDAEANITKICITYLSFTVFNSGFCRTDEEFKKRIQDNKLYNYAARNWGRHARSTSSSCQGAREFVKEKVLGLLGNEALVSSCSQAMMASESYGIKGPPQMTGVHLAAYFGLKDTVIELLKNRQAPDLKDTYGRTALSYAAENGHEEVVKLLLEKDGVDINSKGDSCGQTALSYAAENGYEEVVKLLLEKDGVDINSKDVGYGWTALSYAVEHGYEEVVKLLLEKDGVDINSKDTFGRTALSYAAENGYEEVVKLLLEKNGVDINSKDDFGQAALSYAAEKGHEEVVKLLLEKDRVDINSKDNCWTALSYAAENGHEAVVKLLLEKDRVDINSKDSGYYDRTALSYAAGNGHDAVVKLLLEKDGVDINSKGGGYYGRTALSYAAENGYEVVVKLLLEKDGVDINSKDSGYGQTALSYAAGNGHDAVVKLLLEKDGVDINSKGGGYYGRTALSYAAENGYEVVVKLLLEKDGVDINSKDSGYGRTALSYAAEKGHEEVVKLLLEKDRVDINSKDNFCWTALSYAEANGHEVVAKLLLEHNSVSH